MEDAAHDGVSSVSPDATTGDHLGRRSRTWAGRSAARTRTGRATPNPGHEPSNHGSSASRPGGSGRRESSLPIRSPPHRRSGGPDGQGRRSARRGLGRARSGVGRGRTSVAPPTRTTARTGGRRDAPMVGSDGRPRAHRDPPSRPARPRRGPDRASPFGRASRCRTARTPPPRQACGRGSDRKPAPWSPHPTTTAPPAAGNRATAVDGAARSGRTRAAARDRPPGRGAPGPADGRANPAATSSRSADGTSRSCRGAPSPDAAAAAEGDRWDAGVWRMANPGWRTSSGPHTPG